MWNKLEKLRKQYIDEGIMDSIDHEKFCMMSIVYNSSKIEGCSLTETDTRVLLENNITAHGKPLTDHLMVKDHYHAFLKIKEEAAKKRSFSIDFLKDVNALVMQSTGGIVRAMAGDFDTSKGELRRVQVYVEKKYFPDFAKVPELLKKMIENVNTRIDKVQNINILKLAADVHFNFVNIHPFGDGNGRTARLLMNYIQLYHNEPLVKIFSEDRAEYIDCLNLAEENEDIDVFRDFVCRQQIKFYELELEKFNKSKSGFNLMF